MRADVGNVSLTHITEFCYRDEEEVFHFDHTVVPEGLITMRSRMIYLLPARCFSGNIEKGLSEKLVALHFL